MNDPAVRPFSIDVPDDVLHDLAERLRRVRLPGEVAGAGWAYGTELGYLEELVRYWRDEFDWREIEASLNRLPQFMATVRDVDLHFVHAKGVGPRPFPLLFSHGWPGSFWEVHKIIGPLTDPAAHGGDPADAFDVVAPSLPGYGFSPDAGTPGMHSGAIADLFAALMTETLGYERFGAQGGDWGAGITSQLGDAYPDVVTGIHVNMVAAQPTLDESSPPLTGAEKAFMAEAGQWLREEGAYYALQSTKPQTLAFALTDSPAGLAAWIVEKFRTWSDCDGDVERRFTKDELLTNVMIYWVTGCIGSSVRLYYESARARRPLPAGHRIAAPAGFASFKAELTHPPREWIERAYNLRRWSAFDRGGHFAALEEPELLVEDVRAFFRPLRAASEA
jgi:pimeloyl-ACP methyl ester carboxylesterase